MTQRWQAAAAMLASLGLAMPAQAYLFWTQPNFATPGMPAALPVLQGATEKETAANKLWSVRAGLNVAALQCQFAPALMTVRNYNDLLHHHADELRTAYATLSAYFRRTGGQTWQTKLDSYTTKVYQSYVAFHTQLGFCEEAGLIGRDALSLPRGRFTGFAADRIDEFRNSVTTPAGDTIAAVRAPDYNPGPMACTDKRGRARPCT